MKIYLQKLLVATLSMSLLLTGACVSKLYPTNPATIDEPPPKSLYSFKLVSLPTPENPILVVRCFETYTVQKFHQPISHDGMRRYWTPGYILIGSGLVVTVYGIVREKRENSNSIEPQGIGDTIGFLGVAAMIGGAFVREREVERAAAVLHQAKNTIERITRTVINTEIIVRTNDGALEFTETSNSNGDVAVDLTPYLATGEKDGLKLNFTFAGVRYDTTISSSYFKQLQQYRDSFSMEARLYQIKENFLRVTVKNQNRLRVGNYAVFFQGKQIGIISISEISRYLKATILQKEPQFNKQLNAETVLLKLP